MVISRTKQDQGFSNPGFLEQDFAEYWDPGIFLDGIILKFGSLDLMKKVGEILFSS